MFTWEEAGLLRQLIQVLLWAVLLAAIVAILVLEREALIAGAMSAWHWVATQVQRSAAQSWFR